MAVLHPFAALRPRPSVVSEIVSVPYDVISAAEARVLAEGNPASFLHVIRPEIDLPVGVDEYSDVVYATGAANLKKCLDSNDWVREESPRVYVYRLVMDGRAQTGVFGCVSVSDYDNDVILKHEKTRPVKEDDRTRHIVEQRAHAEPVMLTYKDSAEITSLVEQTVATEPLYTVTADDGVSHTIWRVNDTDAMVAAFAGIDNLYVADGHHRCKAASRAAEEVGATAGSNEVRYFPAVLFPMGDMHIMAYNRVIIKLPEPASTFLEKLRLALSLAETQNAVPTNKGEICVYLGGSWYKGNLPESRKSGAVSTLDVARLGEFVLEPLLEITDPRRDPNIDFIGGIRGTVELERRVDNGDVQMAISMYPTSIEELILVSDAGMLMPPKSTWFEPKLRSGFLVHTF